MTNDSTCPDSPPSGVARLVLMAIVAMYVVLAGLVLLVRQSEWTLGWIYVGLFAASDGICKASLFIWNIEVAWRRTHIVSGTKTWDKVWIAVLLTVLLTVFFVAVREFNAPFGRLDLKGIAWLTGLAIYVSGWALFTWAGVSNPFFEVTVRIQTDQGHRVMDKGPYSIVRHPGYVGFIATFLATPLLLPSSWIYLLSLMAALLFVVRTAVEDRTLQAELPGYAEYATRVRFRLIPGVW